jgi:hypothetical protein
LRKSACPCGDESIGLHRLRGYFGPIFFVNDLRGRVAECPVGSPGVIAAEPASETDFLPGNGRVFVPVDFLVMKHSPSTMFGSGTESSKAPMSV